MDKDSKPGIAGVSGNGLIAVLVLAAGAYVLHTAPLEGTRPAANEPKIEQRFAIQDIDARLWQDPFGAVARAREDLAKKLTGMQLQEDIDLHTDVKMASTIADKANDKVKEIVVLAVMLSGGANADNVEWRRRSRYAVLAGLNASNYAPVDTEHLGYFVPSNNTAKPRRLPENVPYEWFEPAPDSRGATAAARQVLVLWIDNDAFYKDPLANLRYLIASLQPAVPEPAMRWQVLGPATSDGLRSMVSEVSKAGFNPELFKGLQIQFHSPSATASDKALLAPLGRDPAGQTLPVFLHGKGIELLRSIGDDHQLAKRLTDELKLRGLKVRAQSLPPGDDGSRQEAYRSMCRVKGQLAGSPDHIAVVAEWDTLYGRSLRRQFMIDSHDDEGFCVSRYHYVRGIDGQLPERGSTPSAAAAAAKETASAKDATQRNDGSFIERAEGQSQYDYLRRLAARLLERDRELRSTNIDGAGLRAIGVLGNDVHDKLLVLQALQPEFPNAIFFTTDLDARFLHPREQPWARNLIVASSFGLRLNDELQGGTPPFRDSYQTAAYFSTLLALAQDRSGQSVSFTQDRLVPWLVEPRLFEIGRNAAFDFSAPAVAPGSGVARPCHPRALLSCDDVHPPGTTRYPHVSKTALALGASGLLLLLWLPAVALGRPLRRRLRRFVAQGTSSSGRWRRRLVLVAAVLVLQLAVPALLASGWTGFADWLTRNGKPISFDEGISIWPTEAIHLFTLLLCVYLVCRGLAALTRNLDQIALAFHLGKTRRQLLAEQDRQDRDLKWWQKLANMFSCHVLYAGKPAPSALGDEHMSEATLALWKLYIIQNRTVARLMRSLACVLAAGAFCVLLLYASNELPGLPQRGVLSARVYLWLGVATVLAMSFLVFYVADATLFCVRFVRDLRRPRVNWPERTVQFFASRLGALPTVVLDHWIDLQFLAQRTRCVTGLIYYPFIVLSLLLLSRSAIFDDWHLPLALLVMVLLSVAVVMGCAVALRRSAEHSRALALKAVADAQLRASAKDAEGQPAPAQLELLCKHIEALNDGAFAPFSQQPLLKAVLLTFATLGGTTLLEYLALANI